MGLEVNFKKIISEKNAVENYYQRTLKGYMNERGEIETRTEAKITRLEQERKILMENLKSLKYNNTQINKEKGGGAFLRKCREKFAE